jgi:hypothetical protein
MILLVTVNAAFGAGLFFFAFRALQRGWPFLKTGWLMMQTQTSAPDFRTNVERRRAISEGGRFLIGGLLWLAAGLGSFVGAAYFLLQAWVLMHTTV